MLPFTTLTQDYIKNLRGAIQSTTIALGDHEIFPPLLHYVHIVAATLYTVMLEDMLGMEVTRVNGEGKTHHPVAQPVLIVSELQGFHELLVGEAV